MAVGGVGLGIVTLFIVLLLGLLVTRVATIALTMTGLSQDTARFQARSAFTGVGFTTNESERLVSHPQRRRILLILMLLGNVGVVTVVASVILSLVAADSPQQGFLRLLGIVILLLILYVLLRTPAVDRRLSWLIEKALGRYTHLRVRDYESLLRLMGDYAVSELEVQEDDWLAGRTLGELRLSDEGVQVLGIRRTDGTYVGAPTGATEVQAGDSLILYGRSSNIADLDERRPGLEGEVAHRRAVVEQRRTERTEATEDPATPGPDGRG